MAVWLIPCNLTKYDVVGAFQHLPAIDWKQGFNAEVGDIVLIYVSKPISALVYSTCVRKVDLETIEIDDSKFVIDGKGYLTAPKHMELELIGKLDQNKYALAELRKYGVKGNLQGPMRAPDVLIDALRAFGDL